MGEYKSVAFRRDGVAAMQQKNELSTDLKYYCE